MSFPGIVLEFFFWFWILIDQSILQIDLFVSSSILKIVTFDFQVRSIIYNLFIIYFISIEVNQSLKAANMYNAVCSILASKYI